MDVHGNTPSPVLLATSVQLGWLWSMEVIQSNKSNNSQ